MQFVDEPRDVVRSPMPIIVCGAKCRVDSIILTRRLVGVDTHWFGGHTIACCGTENCPACFKDAAPVWKGYFVGKSMSSGNLAIILVTAGCFEAFERHLQHKDGLVGLRCVLDRAGHRSNSPMRATIYHRVPDYEEFPYVTLLRMVQRIFAANANKADSH